MSSNAGNQNAPTGQAHLDHYPPPLGPPPGNHPAPQGAPQHSNEMPIPEYNIPPYDPSHPQYAPPPDSELYDEPSSSTNQQGGQGKGAKSSWGDRLAALGQQAAVPFNTLANKMGSESFLPTTMDKECEKAARILRGFCKDGIYSESAPGAAAARPVSPSGKPSATAPNQPATADTGTKPKHRGVILHIPSKVISNAAGLAIFTTARAGFHVSGATGSGVLIARLPDGSWSPPSGIQVHSVGAGFVIGVDIYDCVVVINTREALAAFTSTRVSLGSDLAVTAGPWGAGGSVDFGASVGEKGRHREDSAATDGKGSTQPAAAQQPPTGYPQAQYQQLQNLAPGQPAGVDTRRPAAAASAGTATTARPGSSGARDRKPSPLRDAIKNTKPVYSYVKSRGFYAGVQVDGTVVTERKDANAAFYGARVGVAQILRGEVPQVGQGPAGAAGWPGAARGLFDVLRGAEGWHGQQRSQQQGGGAGMAGVTAGMGQMDPHLGAGAGVGVGGGQQRGGTPYESKAAEAAAEARVAEEGGAPPSYMEPTAETTVDGEEMPPAYVDDVQARPGVGDAKSGAPHYQ